MESERQRRDRASGGKKLWGGRVALGLVLILSLGGAGVAEAEVGAGAVLYNNHCIACHGQRGDGRGGGRKGTGIRGARRRSERGRKRPGASLRNLPGGGLSEKTTSAPLPSQRVRPSGGEPAGQRPRDSRIRTYSRIPSTTEVRGE